MRTLSMVNDNNNTPRIPRAIRGNRKYQYSRGELDKDDIKKRMENFGVEPTAMIERDVRQRRSRGEYRGIGTVLVGGR